MGFITTNFTSIILFLNIIFAIAIIFLERKNTSQTWSWVLVLTFIPVLGFILYIFIGRGISKERIFELKIKDEIGAEEELKRQKEKLLSNTFPVPKTKTIDAKQLIYMMTVYDDALYTLDNDIKIYMDGTEKFEALFEDIRNAKNHVHLQYYIYRNDDLGQRLRNELIKVAEKGVEVRVLIDAWGSTGIGKKFFEPLKKVGGQVQEFFPLFLPYINPRLNYRNHRKIVVIDGEIGYTGGFNVGDEYLGKVAKFGYWRDNHLRIRGEAVYSLQNRFLLDWNSQFKPKVKLRADFFPKIIPSGDKDIQIVTSGPDTEHEQIKFVYLKMINTAKKEILIQTPYYIPDESIHEALKLAMLSGVKVRLQIPNKPDHMLVYWATYSFAAELLEFGAIVETYEKGFMHAKTMIIDGEVVSVGSANIDIRSFRLDFELNAIVFDKEVATIIRKGFFQDSQDSKLLTKELYQKRGLIIKIKEGLARLISPLL